MKQQRPIKYISVCIVAFLLLTTFLQGANAVEPVQKTSTLFNKASFKQGTFGFANLDGTKLLVDYPQEQELKWSQLNIAVGHKGQRLKLKYIGKQKEGKRNNGRQTAYNFDNLRGLIYEVVEGKAEPNETYFIVKDSALTDRMLVELKSINKEKITTKLKSEIGKLKKRAVKNLWPLENINGVGKLYLVEFKAKGNNMLASFALKTTDGWVFKDYPAKFKDNSAWRIDDSGEITPDMFTFTFAARTSQGVVIGVQWMGAEGESTSFLEFTKTIKGKKAKKAKLTELNNVGYGRYMMPI
ncbi:hypothetical protein J2Z32_002440 [Paenibacillus turicensis]|uniref:Uncharacterized protein n=1 Tax=Paenibacillus turicensis TaxID=160487 RepID=A0ABS4FT88_9BACL|nr:hypothetical protein [Paenibacillus turicensis]MBP1905792.1 hypothetical protein [Paenibacillus turicensis]